MAMPATVREWTDLIRRARLGRTVKGVALLIATYADSDGTRVYPGVARIAVEAEVDYKTAQRSVAELVKAGLLTIVRGHTGRRGQSTEYRLSIDENAMTPTTVLTPDGLGEAVETVRAKNRRRPHSPSTGPAGPCTEAGEGRDNPDSTGNGPPCTEADGIDDLQSAEGVVQGTALPREGVVQGTALPRYRSRRSAVPTMDLVTRTTLHENQLVAVVSNAKVGRARGSPKKIISGNGFCLDCYATGRYTLAAGEQGSACSTHLRAKAAA
jgi:Helix-turn-helix domain